MNYSWGPPGVIYHKFTMTAWAERPENKKAWRELAEKYDLVEKEFRDSERVFSFLDAAISWSQTIHFRYVYQHLLHPWSLTLR